jgi:formate hydrogenlyase transcriptional activator
MIFLAQYGKQFGKRVEAVSRGSMERLMAYGWPGNIRELQNVIERAVILAPGGVLELDDDVFRAAPVGVDAATARDVAPAPARRAPDAGLAETLEEVERAQITAALPRSGGVVEGPRGAAGVLGMHPNTLRSRMDKLGIRRTGSESP